MDIRVTTKLLFPALLFFTNSGCAGIFPSWPRAELAPGAADVKVLKSTGEAKAAGCKRVGVATGQVVPQIGGIRRDPGIVKEDIYIKAKNSTFFQGGDTMAPVGKIEGGMQNFVAYKCNKH